MDVCITEAHLAALECIQAIRHFEGIAGATKLAAPLGSITPLAQKTAALFADLFLSGQRLVEKLKAERERFRKSCATPVEHCGRNAASWHELVALVSQEVIRDVAISVGVALIESAKKDSCEPSRESVERLCQLGGPTKDDVNEIAIDIVAEWAIVLPALASDLLANINSERLLAGLQSEYSNLDVHTQSVIPSPQCRLKVKNRVATLDDTSYPISYDGELLLNLLLNAKGDWISGTQINQEGITKPGRVRDNLPESIRSVVEAKTGAGFRIPLCKISTVA